jgi:hypothetical protein
LDLGFLSPSSSECQASGNPCGEYGSYNNLTSTTAVLINPDGYSDQVADFGTGPLIADTVEFAGLTLPNTAFGVKTDIVFENDLNPQVGIIGNIYT